MTVTLAHYFFPMLLFFPQQTCNKASYYSKFTLKMLNNGTEVMEMLYIKKINPTLFLVSKWFLHVPVLSYDKWRPLLNKTTIKLKCKRQTFYSHSSKISESCINYIKWGTSHLHKPHLLNYIKRQNIITVNWL